MEVVYAVTTIRVGLPNGTFGVVQKGTHWPADDPVVRGHPEAFSTDPRYGLNFSQQPDGYDEPPVEQATAGPGEQRTTRRRAG
jgi:hypothetical protein